MSPATLLVGAKAWLVQWGLVLAMVAAGLGWTTAGVQSLRLAHLQTTTARAAEKASEAAREKERVANIENGKVTDELLQDAARARAAADSSAERLRQLSATRSPAAAACAGNHETAAANLPDRTREDLESQADRADEVARQLAAAQAYITQVCLSARVKD